MTNKQDLVKWMTEIRESLTFENKTQLIKDFWNNKDRLDNIDQLEKEVATKKQKLENTYPELFSYLQELELLNAWKCIEVIIQDYLKNIELNEELNHKLNQLIARILNISEKPTGTFDPELKKQKGIKELLEKYKVKGLEELVNFVDKAVENHQELLNKIELLDIEEDTEREREQKLV